MIKKSAGQTLLENAYKLATPDDNAEYYDAFAPTYDMEFAEELGWRYPAAIAEIYRDACTTADTPIADIGCGTGLVASALNFPPEQIDGIDISAEMLRIAEENSSIAHSMKLTLRNHWIQLQMTMGRFSLQELLHPGI